MADVDKDSMMEKVRKLMALADSKGATEAEASFAAAKIQELVQTYGLDMAQLEDKGVSEVRGMGTVDRRAMFDYQQALMATIAKNNFCFHDIRTIYIARKNRNSKQHFLIGRQLNIQVTVNTYDYLIGTLKRLCEQANLQEHKTRNLFYDGATERLCKRLNDQRAFREAEELMRQSELRARGEGGTTAIALVDLYGSEADLNNDALNHYPPGTTAQRRHKKAADEAARKTREQELLDQGEDKIVAFYMSHGMDRPQAQTYANAYSTKVTKEARRQTRRSSHRGFTQHDRKHWQRRSSAAFRAGEKAGDSIGIDTQIETVEGPKLIK